MYVHTVGSVIFRDISLQARPEDYSREFLAHQVPVSFHKHWNIDPISVFQKWLKDDGMDPASETPQKDIKEEL